MGGASSSVALNANQWFGVVADLGVYRGHPRVSLTGETYTFGPRFTFHQRRNAAFVQTLFGGSHFSVSSGGISGEGTEFAFALGSAIDIGAWQQHQICSATSSRIRRHPRVRLHHQRHSTLRWNRLSHGITHGTCFKTLTRLPPELGVNAVRTASVSSTNRRTMEQRPGRMHHSTDEKPSSREDLYAR